MNHLYSHVRTTAELAQQGISHAGITQRLSQGEIVKLGFGVYCPQETWLRASSKEKCQIQHFAVSKTHVGYVLSHVSAAFWVGAPVLRKPERVWVSSPSKNSYTTERMKVRGNRKEICQQSIVWNGLPVTDHLQTVLDCARTVPFEEALCIADFMLHRGLCTFDELSSGLVNMTGRGARNARLLAERMSSLAESPAETLARNQIIQWGFDSPREQAEVWVNGQLYRPDFMWENQRVILEVDGEIKYSGSYGDPIDVIQAEHRRQRELEQAGYTVLRVRWRDIHQNRAVLFSLLTKAGIARNPRS